MGLNITQGRTWVTGETVTATKLNTAFSSATISYSEYQDAGGTFNAANGDFVFVGISDTVNLPTSPSDNDTVTVAQIDGDLSATSATVDAGSKNIDFNGLDTQATTLTLNKNFIGRLTFVYNSSAGEWKVT